MRGILTGVQGNIGWSAQIEDFEQEVREETEGENVGLSRPHSCPHPEV
jgi:hypothetical protein